MNKTYKDAFRETAGIAKVALDGLEDEMTNAAELMQKNDELERKVHQLKRECVEYLDLLAADTEHANKQADKIDLLERQNAEMLATLKQAYLYFWERRFALNVAGKQVMEMLDKQIKKVEGGE